MKAGKAHTVPLSAAAMAVLLPLYKARLDDDAHVFPGGSGEGGLSSMAIAEMVKSLNDDNAEPQWVDPEQGRPAVPHGFRSTLRTWSAERTNFPRNVAEQALAHTLGDKVEAAYNRGELLAKRRQLMEAWAKHCAAPVVVAGNNVRPIRTAK
jgi:integrase